MNRIFSGIQPTGNLHLGNYLGAIRNWVKLQKDYECIFCVVDLHAITLPQDPAQLRAQTREVTAAYIASGIDPNACTLFNQSNVSAHAELAWVLGCLTPLGWLNRMTQFKEKAGKQRENAGLGLYAYPVLMAADILLYDAAQVPVGDDQQQHLELTRDIAIKFNNTFGETFVIPEPVIDDNLAVVPGLDVVPPLVPPGQAGLNLLELARGTKEGVTGEEMEQGIKRTVAANVMGFRPYEGDVRSQVNNVKREDRDFSEEMTRRWKSYQNDTANGQVARSEQQLREIEELRRQRGYTPQATQEYIAGRIRELEPGKYRQLPTKQTEEILERSRRLGYTSPKDQRAMGAIAAMLQERRARSRSKAGAKRLKKFKPKKLKRVTR